MCFENMVFSIRRNINFVAKEFQRFGPRIKQKTASYICASETCAIVLLQDPVAYNDCVFPGSNKKYPFADSNIL